MTNTPRLLDHLVTMTSIRDLELLEISLLKTIHRLLSPTGLTLFKITASHAISTEINYSNERCTIRQGDIRLRPEVEELISQLQSRDVPELSIAQGDQHATVFTVQISRHGNAVLLIESQDELSRVNAHMLSGMLQFYRNFCQLLQDSQTDPLTGLANRKTFDSSIGRIHQKSSSSSQNVIIERRTSGDFKHWLAMVDIDHFKKINDGFGHLYGDEVLILLSQQFRKTLRADDQVFRFGGEEFVLIIGCNNVEESRATLERLRQDVASMKIPQVGSITVSIGATMIAPATFDGTLLDYADKALYHSKDTGRNRVTFFEDLVTQGLAQPEHAKDMEINLF